MRTRLVTLHVLCLSGFTLQHLCFNHLSLNLPNTTSNLQLSRHRTCTQTVCISKSRQLNVYRAITGVYCWKHTGHTNTLANCGVCHCHSKGCLKSPLGLKRLIVTSDYTVIQTVPLLTAEHSRLLPQTSLTEPRPSFFIQLQVSEFYGFGLVK